MLLELVRQIQELQERVKRAEGWIKAFMETLGPCKKISAIDGIGPITATAMVAAVGEAKEFKNDRHLSAWLGLVPRQCSSGGKLR